MSTATLLPRAFPDDALLKPDEITIVDAPNPITDAPVSADLPTSEDSSKPDEAPKKKKKIRQAIGVIVVDPATKNVLMISSRKKEGALVLPRGECSTESSDEHPEKAAIRVLLDKAGVSAEYLSRRVGTYTQANKKGKIVAHHWMFEVHQPLLLETWPESDRQRVWVPYEEAIEASSGRKMASLALKNCSLSRE